MPKKIKTFKEEPYTFLSNFYPCRVSIGPGSPLVFPSAEHLYVSFKLGLTKDSDKERLINMTSGQAKKFAKGKEVPDWHEIKVGVMYKILKAKFKQNPKLKKKLLKTKDKKLEEGNWWGDTFWGVDIKTGKGENVLGKLLMIVRAELK